jgi:hypothetical protein
MRRCVCIYIITKNMLPTTVVLVEHTIYFLGIGLELWCLTLLSRTFQLYHGSQFY